MRALILVDIQNDFCPGGALAVAEGDAVVEVANRLMPAYDLVVATQDWHPPAHKSFSSNNPGTKPGDLGSLGGAPQVMWPDHCVQGTPGAEFHPRLDMNRVEAIFRKGTDPEVDSYSGFYDNAKLKSTGLMGYLKGKGVTEVAVVGLATDYCVKYTALDALEAGFAVTLIEDAARGVNLSPGDVEAAVRAMREAGVAIARSETVTA